MQKNTPKKAIVLLNMGGASSLNEVEIFLKNMFGLSGQSAWEQRCNAGCGEVFGRIYREREACF